MVYIRKVVVIVGFLGVVVFTATRLSRAQPSPRDLREFAPFLFHIGVFLAIVIALSFGLVFGFGSAGRKLRPDALSERSFGERQRAKVTLVVLSAVLGFATEGVTGMQGARGFNHS